MEDLFNKRRDVQLESTCTHSNHDVWLIDLGASFNMTPHKEWYCEYEKYNIGGVFLGDDSTIKIIRSKRFKFLLRDMIRTLQCSMGFCTF